MSTVMNPKGRGLGVNTWLTILGISVVIFGVNAGYATWKGSRLASASSAAAALQVNSQRLAVQGADLEGARGLGLEQQLQFQLQLRAVHRGSCVRVLDSARPDGAAG